MVNEFARQMEGKRKCEQVSTEASSLQIYSASIRDRPKQGFGVPINEWLRGPLCAWAEERLFDRSSYDGLPISRDESMELYRVHKSGKRNFHSLLWALLMLIDQKPSLHLRNKVKKIVRFVRIYSVM